MSQCGKIGKMGGLCGLGKRGKLAINVVLAPTKRGWAVTIIRPGVVTLRDGTNAMTVRVHKPRTIYYRSWIQPVCTFTPAI